ncbi:Gfo/Idh/MocA family protein [Pseudalkalibacillus caeni]|uniref:Gfo/Idh/MocA family oxidoreductase n=1 Tax=Exobacillus caeni TaxID=2574798 RepID=A0A5R9F6Q0_9BACL|nr:Gfo/Idh/MocA family oxidoreductase [Pseudalkalibacillus caeni]TLS36503.1 Gfo/Idh/MocA family oxidoreductase [Pseudalkalibacillus caeni]
MVETRLKIGIAGAGSFTELWYLPILEQHPNIQLQAICSASGTSASRLAEKYNIQKSYQSYKEMLEKEDLDGLCIVTPNESHMEIAIEACRRGIHVICEKPLAMDQEEARSMLEAAQQNNIVHAVNFTYRENTAVKKLREMLENGKIGQVYEGRFQYTGAYGLAGPPGWRGTRAIGGGGGVLADLGSHLIDLVQYVLQENIESVQASLSYLHEGKLKGFHDMKESDQSVDSAFFKARFPSGIHGSFFTSWIASQGNRNQTIELSFNGSEGAIQLLSSELGIQLQYATGNGSWKEVAVEGVQKWEDDAEPAEERFRPWRLTESNEIWKWADRIIESKAKDQAVNGNMPDFKDGYEVQKVIDGVLESADLEKKILVDKK